MKCNHSWKIPGLFMYIAKIFGLLHPHLSWLHQCDQRMLPNRLFEGSLRSFFINYICLSYFSEDLFGYIHSWD